MRRLHTALLIALAAVALLATARSAPAQPLSKWGHPVISIGATPYDAVSTGHGNYPGSNGFIPGYGYYPGPLPSRYPWLDGPPHPLAPLHTAPAIPHPDEDVPPTAALLRVRVPADAELWFGGAATVQRGDFRRFVTPPLTDNGNLTYEVRARWRDNGRPVERVQTVRVHPGDRLTVEFLTPADEAPTLKLPRKVEQP